MITLLHPLVLQKKEFINRGGNHNAQLLNDYPILPTKKFNNLQIGEKEVLEKKQLDFNYLDKEDIGHAPEKKSSKNQEYDIAQSPYYDSYGLLKYDSSAFMNPNMNYDRDYFFNNYGGISFFNGPFQNWELNEENIAKLIEARNKARKELKFQEADYIRAFLKNKGIALIDEKGARGKGTDVTTWKYLKYWKGALVEC
jgi:hypothetical protein